MNILITADMRPSDEVKGLELATTRHLKTKTVIEVKLDDKSTADVVSALTKDVELLGLEGSPFGPVTVMVEGAPAWGRLLNRATLALGKIGILLDEPVPLAWEAEAGQSGLEVKDGTGLDLPFVVEVLYRMACRAKRVMGYTQHPLTLFDLKQTIGLVHDVKQKLEGAANLAGWFDLHELSIAEETKAAKAKAAKAAKTEDTVDGRGREVGKKATQAAKAKHNALPKAKAPAKAKEGNAANLANLT